MNTFGPNFIWFSCILAIFQIWHFLTHGTIHLRRRQISQIFDPYPPTVGSFLVLSVGKFVQFLTPPPLWHADVLNGWSPCIKIKKIWGQMYSFEVVDNRPLYIFHKVLLAPSKCLSKGIKVDKLDYLKSHPRDFKNSFYFGIV